METELAESRVIVQLGWMEGKERKRETFLFWNLICIWQRAVKAKTE
jgi:hypothetical protein